MEDGSYLCHYRHEDVEEPDGENTGLVSSTQALDSLQTTSHGDTKER